MVRGAIILFFCMPMVGTKRVYAGKPTYKSKKRKGTSLKTEVFRLKKQLNAQKNIGHVDLFLESNANGTADISLLNGVAQGTDEDERLSNSITMKALEYRCAMFPGSTQSTNQTSTVLFVLDRNPNGALAGATDILEAASPRSMTNWENKARFKILKRITQVIGDTTDSTGLYPVAKGYINLSEMPVTYTGTAGAIANLVTNALLCLRIGEGASDNSTSTRVQVDTRFTFNQ